MLCYDKSDARKRGDHCCEYPSIAGILFRTCNLVNNSRTPFIPELFTTGDVQLTHPYTHIDRGQIHRGAYLRLSTSFLHDFIAFQLPMFVIPPATTDFHFPIKIHTLIIPTSHIPFLLFQKSYSSFFKIFDSFC